MSLSGASHEIRFCESIVALVKTEPNPHDKSAVRMKLAPLTMTDVCPASGPRGGVAADTCISAKYSNLTKSML